MPLHYLKRINQICLLTASVILLTSCLPTIEIEQTSNGLRIHDVQGCGHLSSYAGDFVKDIPGIVISKNSKGFYLQDNQPDDMDCSSEAVYVFENSYPDVIPGDRVLVSGKIDEFYPGNEEDYNLSVTEITEPEVKVLSSGNELPEPVILGDGGRMIPGYVIDDDGLKSFDPETDGIDFFESLESMLVQIDSGVVVGSRNSYNEVVIIPTAMMDDNLISSMGGLLKRENDANPERIILNLNDSNVDKVTTGALLAHTMQGIVDYSYGNFKVNTFGTIRFENQAFASDPIKLDGTYLSLASYNTENLSRFDEESKFKKTAKIIVNSLDAPDIMVLHEVMDDSGVEDDGVVTAQKTIEKLIDAIIAIHGPEYSYIDNTPEDGQDGGIKGGNIRSVILYNTHRGISLVESESYLGLRNNPSRIGESSSSFRGTRKPLVTIFQKNNSQVLLIAAHLTSRAADSPLYGRLQPISTPEEQQRVQQAVLIREFIEEFSRDNPGTRIIVAGDMNDDPWSDTIMTLTQSNLIDLGTLLDERERFSYILDGNAIQLDYILATGTQNHNDQFYISHINSLSDHSSQVSDHDAVMALIELE